TFADIAIKAEKPDLAIPICESFMSRDNLDGEALVTLCAAYIRKGDEASAVNLLEQTSAIAPEKPASWLALAEIWTSLGRTEMAMESLRKAKAALPANPSILLALGKLYYENERPTEAVSVLKQAFQLDQDDPEIRNSLAKAYLTHGYLNEAWSVIGALEADYTSDPDLALTLGNVMLALGDYQAPKPVLRFAWQSSRSDESLMAYARLLLQGPAHAGALSAGDSKELARLLEAVHAKAQPESGSFDFKVLEADIQYAQDCIETAYKSYLELLDQPEGKTPRTYFHLQHQIGQCALKLGHTDVSISALQEAVLVNPDNLEVRHTLSEAFAAAGMRDESLAAAKATLQLAPTELDNVLWYSHFCGDNGNEREAIQVLKDTLYLLPDEQTLYLALARAYLATGSTAETKETLNRMLERENISTEEYVNVANIYLHMNDSAEAARIIRLAIANNPQPDFSEARKLAYTVLRLGDGAAALHLLAEIEKPLGSHPCFPILKSDVLAGNKQFLPALQNLESLLKEIEFSGSDLPFEAYFSAESDENIPDYNRAGVLYRAAQLERSSGDMAAAQKHAGQAFTLQPDKGEYLLLKSELAFALRKTEKLDSALEQLENNPGSPAHQGLTRLLAVNALIERDPHKIHLLLDHFLARQSPSAVFHAGRAFLALTEGRAAQAEDELHSAEALLEEAYARSGLEAFSIPAHFAWLWQALAAATAAFEAKLWDLADKCFGYALAEIKINPVVNQQLAEYLVEKARVTNNARALRIVQRLPHPFSADQTDEEVHQEQISIAGRYIPAAEMLPTLKIGQALFSGRWNDGEELKLLVRDSRQAAQALSVQLDSDAIKNISAAFPEAFDVAFQETVLLLYKNPAACAEKAKSLLVKQPDNPWLYTMLAIARQAEPEKAAVAIEKALEIWPDEPDWHAIAGTFHEQSGAYEKAAKHLEDAIHILPKSAQYWQQLGDIKVLEKDYHSARDYFTKANELFPGDPEALFSLAVINQQLGEHQAAIQCLREVETLDPGKTIYAESIAESLFAMQDYQAAEEQANRVLQTDAYSSRALQLKAKALMKQRRYEEAKRVLQAAREMVSDPIPFDLLAIELDASTQRKSGLGAALALAETNPENPLVLNTLAGYYLEANMQTQAEETLHHSLEIDGQNPQTLVMLGRIARRRGNLDQALAYLTRALAVDPSLMDAYLELGQTYQDRRDNTRALDTYHRAIEMVEKDPRAYIQAAAAYKDSKDYRNAESMLRQAAQFAPNDPVIRRQLASIVALNLVNNLQEAPKRR
ncbi:MAG: tetratricopeptide repeat protein, partial [Anaerolineaceae bacterium]